MLVLFHADYILPQLFLVSQSDWLISVVDKSLDNAARVNQRSEILTVIVKKYFDVDIVVENKANVV